MGKIVPPLPPRNLEEFIAQTEMLKKRRRRLQAQMLAVIVAAIGAILILCVFMLITP